MSTFPQPQPSGYRGGQGPPQRTVAFQRAPELPSRLPESYLKKGYFDVQGNLLPELVTGEQILQVTRAIGQKQGQAELKTAQLRRFYGKAKSIEQKLDSGHSFDSLRPELLTMQALAANTVARGNASDIFKDFIDGNIALASKDKDHFRKGFLVHFQSVVAYFSYLFRR